MLDLFLLLAIFLPILYFFCVGLFRSEQTEDISLFYRMDGHASQSSYTQSTVAYMLQTATTFYFIYWGYNCARISASAFRGRCRQAV